MKAWGLNDNFLGFIQTMYQILVQVVERLDVWYAWKQSHFIIILINYLFKVTYIDILTQYRPFSTSK